MVIKKADQQWVEHLKQICKQGGIKLTYQRLEIYRELISGNDHPSAECIYLRLIKKIPTIALDTVYRTLTTFEELGIVKKLHLTGERALFDVNLNQHHHFVCSRCLAVQDVYWPEFDNSIFPEPTDIMGLVYSRHIELRGVCAPCIKDKEQQSTP